MNWDLELFKAILSVGFTCWSAISASNNIIGFKGASHSIAQTISMAPLLEEPAMKVPMLSRRIESPRVASLLMLGILLLQVPGTIIMAVGSWQLVSALIAGGDPAAGIAIVTAGLSVLCLLWIMMMSAGIWFAYWYRQPQMHSIHVSLLTLLVLVTAALHV